MSGSKDGSGPDKVSGRGEAERRPLHADPWETLRGRTRARVGLMRTGNAPLTRDVLSFQAAHAMARDAVHTPLDVGALQAALAPSRAVVVSSAAADRATYLRRPDLGRELDPASRALLPRGNYDLAFVLADGLSAQAVASHGPALFHACSAALSGWHIAPPVIALQGRVALGDDIAEHLGTAMVAVLIGERPGLSVPDSMGVYLTYAPRRGCADSQRNCLSNIHAHGLSLDEACGKLVWLIREARTLGLTGVGLKERAHSAALSPPDQAEAIDDTRQDDTQSGQAMTGCRHKGTS